MKQQPLDEFRRTPLRRYDVAPKKPKEKRLEEREHRLRKRYFDLPEMSVPLGRAALGVLSGVMLFGLCNASAPMSEVPGVQQRFDTWKQTMNEQAVSILPGPTPEPGTELAQAVAMTGTTQEELTAAAQQQEAVIEEQNATPGPVPKFKHYEPGELAYHGDNIDVTIEQKTKGNMTYFVCDIQISDVSQLRSAFAGDDFRSGIYEAASDIARRHSPVIAVNADFCRYHRDGVIIRNGEALRKQNITKHHLLIVDKEGNLSALTDRSGKQGVVANNLVSKQTWQTFEFGPVLVQDGKAVSLPKSFTINCNDGYYEPRTAVGQLGPLHYMLIVVDGRRPGYSNGCSLPQLQELFLEEGAQFAFNLDGGGSTSLYFRGEVVNMPSGGSERSVSDVLMFMANPQ